VEVDEAADVVSELVALSDFVVLVPAVVVVSSLSWQLLKERRCSEGREQWQNRGRHTKLIFGAVSSVPSMVGTFTYDKSLGRHEPES
jgi:hypothetical protein